MRWVCNDDDGNDDGWTLENVCIEYGALAWHALYLCAQEYTHTMMTCACRGGGSGSGGVGDGGG